jgi:orotate phosphoribosyltransferase
MEEMAKTEQDVHSIVGVGLNGIPFASFIANNLEKELILYRPHVENQKVGVFSSNFAGQDNKNVVIVDDVMGTGETLSGAIRSVEEAGGNAVLCIVLVNKTEMNDLNGIPLRALLRTRLIQ